MSSDGTSLPTSYAEVVAEIASQLDRESRESLQKADVSDLILWHFSVGMQIRNKYGLWNSGSPLRKSCAAVMGTGDIDPDAASQIIIKGVWERVRSESSAIARCCTFTARAISAALGVAGLVSAATRVDSERERERQDLKRKRQTGGASSAVLKRVRKAAEEGDAEQQYALGLLYSYGMEGAELSPEAAFEWYRKAAEQGHADAQYALHVCYLRGRGVAKSSRVAAQWLRKAAAQGGVDAQYVLGCILRDGTGVAQDYAKAVEWLMKAEQQGHHESMHELGVLYLNGKGVEQSTETGLKWLRKAASLGNREAMYKLGDFYASGDRVKSDLEQARKWFELAVKKGHRDAVDALERLQRFATDVEGGGGWPRLVRR